MLDPEELHQMLTDFRKDMTQIDTDYKNRIRQIQRRALAGRLVGIGLFVAGSIIVKNAQK